MTPTQVLQEIRKMRFEEAYEGWSEGRLTQAAAAQILGMCERSFRRYLPNCSISVTRELMDTQAKLRCVFCP